MKSHPPSHWSLWTKSMPSLHREPLPSQQVTTRKNFLLSHTEQTAGSSLTTGGLNFLETGSEAELWNRKFLRGFSPEEPQERKERAGWSGTSTQRQWHLLAGKEAIEVSGCVAPFQRKASPGFRSTQEGTLMSHLQKEVPGKDSARYHQ